MNDLHVRRYEPADRDDVWAVHDRALRASAMDYDPEYNRYLRHVPREFLGVGGEFLVGTLQNGDTGSEGRDAGDTGAVVAIGGYQPLSVLGSDYADLGYDRLGPAFDDSVRVRSVAVLPAFQSRGVGTALVADLHRRAAADGFEQALLETPRTLTAARSFWASRGYEHVDDAGAHAVYRTRL